MTSESGQNLVVSPLNNDDKSAISRLSNEILALFFTEAVLSKSDKELREEAGGTLSGLIRLPTEVSISHVCRQWRAISLDLSVLWKTFYFSCNPDSHSRTVIARFQSYMERSGAQLLDLWFDLASVPQAFELAEHAMKYAARWRRFSIFLYSETSVESLLLIFLTLHAPNLEYLAIHPHDYENEIREETEIDSDLLSIPFILPGSLKLSSFWFDISALPYFLPPLSNITTLRIDSSGFRQTIEIDMDAFLSILAIPGLEQFSLAGNIIEYDDPDSVEPLTVPHLKHLQIVDAYTPAQLLKVIDAPLLDILVLERITFYASKTEHEFIDPFPALRTLVLLEVGISSYASGLALATFTENITNLVISADSIDSGVLEFIQDRLGDGKDVLAQGESNLWPKLQDITFSLAHYEEPTFYKNFLAARPINTPPLILHIHEYLLNTWRYYPGYLASIRGRANLVPMKNDRPIVIIKEGWHLGRGKFGDHLDTFDTLEIESPDDFARYSFEYESEESQEDSEVESEEESEASIQEDSESKEENA